MMKIVIDVEVPDGSLEPDILDIEDEIKETLTWMVSKGMIDDYDMEVKGL